MKTEGLEGLAALASASASSPSQGETTSTTNPPGQTATTSEMSVAAPASTSRSVSSSAPTASASAGMDGNYGLLTASNIMQALQAGQTQQWHQTVASTNNAMNPSALSNSNIALLMGMQQQQQQQQIPQAPPQPNASTLNTMQQINYYQQLMNGQAGQQMTNGAGGGASSGSDFVNPNQAMALSLALQSQQRTQATDASSNPAASRMQVLPTTTQQARVNVDSASAVASGAGTMPPPPATSVNPISVSTLGIQAPARRTASGPQKIAPQPGNVPRQVDGSPFEHHVEQKKKQKRAVNRLSAQLSRKRKKQYIEELKEENDDLRRKELILRSIPDLIVVFDSAGKLWFVSESVSMFLGMTASELEGASFWDRLCEDSVRLLKAAFMDSLAARAPGADTVPLGSGVWELRLVDKDMSQKIVTLHGVVHFAGDRPECVCSIRPVDPLPTGEAKATEAVKEATTVSIRHHVKPQQSVVSNVSSDSSGDGKSKRQAIAGGKGREVIRISDSGNSSTGDSDSGSSDGLIGVQ